ncbi:hypothetical protein [[Mycobacterium] nativiensis]|uniref:Uncharacterized protein n=1 Tax=[Mycobacterium] nativiensis TaxID=2855503 RepID=A0ABU5Y4F7_9MYCO|nr:hypothetical protein [Mycolicibacter sp. MYC340]MEB3033845.1 hypothetical protein [Mycolicibacter sp. MYC340]
MAILAVEVDLNAQPSAQRFDVTAPSIDLGVASAQQRRSYLGYEAVSVPLTETVQIWLIR